MNWINKIYVFPDCVQSIEKEELQVDLEGHCLSIFHNGNHSIIDFDALEPGTSTQLVSGWNGDMVLYNYRELLMIYGLKPLEFLQTFHLHGWVQVDKTHRGVFVKIFCPAGQWNPVSRKTNWSQYPHVGTDQLSQVDRKNSWSFIPTNIQIWDGALDVTGTLWKSELWQDELLYFNHGGQAAPLYEGGNHFSLIYVPGEDAYVGSKYSRYVGRRIKLEAVK